MEKQNLAVLIMVGVFIIYTSFIELLTNDRKKKRGPLPSISDSFDILKKGWKMLFSLFALGLAAPLSMFLETSGLFFIPMACLTLLAAAPYTKLPRELTMHVIGASGSIGFILIIMIIVYGSWWWLVIGLITAIAFKRPKIQLGWYLIGETKVYAEGIYIPYNSIKNYTWWIEHAAFFIIAIGLLIR